MLVRGSQLSAAHQAMTTSKHLQPGATKENAGLRGTTMLTLVRDSQPFGGPTEAPARPGAPPCVVAPGTPLDEEQNAVYLEGPRCPMAQSPLASGARCRSAGTQTSQSHVLQPEWCRSFSQLFACRKLHSHKRCLSEITAVPTCCCSASPRTSMLVHSLSFTINARRGLQREDCQPKLPASFW